MNSLNYIIPCEDKKSYAFIETDNIISCDAGGEFIVVNLFNDEQFSINKDFLLFTELSLRPDFIRLKANKLINKKQIARYDINEGYLVMKNGKVFNIEGITKASLMGTSQPNMLVSA